MALPPAPGPGGVPLHGLVPALAIPSVSIFSPDIEIVQVWHGNERERLREIQALIPFFPYLGFDTEFVQSGTSHSPRPTDRESAYSQLRAMVVSGDIVQLGVALCNDRGELPGRIWQFNFRVDTTARAYDASSINFLANTSGIDLDAHGRRGISSWLSSNAFSNFLREADGNVNWVCFHGGFDIGFILKLAVGIGAGLPSDRLNFLNLFGKKFPCFCDLKVVAKELNLVGGLAAVADKLGAERLGAAHQAGPDSLFTLRCLFKMFTKFGVDKVMSCCGRLANVSDPWVEPVHPCTLTCCHGDVLLVDVWEENVASQLDLIACTLPDLYNPIIAVDLLIPGYMPRLHTLDAQTCYKAVLADLDEAPHVRLRIAFTSAEGDLALGRVWQFNFGAAAAAFDNGQEMSEGSKQGVSAGRFSKLLHLTGLSSNIGVTWIAYRGAHTIAFLMKMIMHGLPMPQLFQHYQALRGAYLVNLYDVGILWHGNRRDNISQIAHKLRVICPRMEQSGGGPQHDNDGFNVVLVLSCYMKLACHTLFCHRSFNCRGKLLAACCTYPMSSGSGGASSSSSPTRSYGWER